MAEERKVIDFTKQHVNIQEYMDKVITIREITMKKIADGNMTLTTITTDKGEIITSTSDVMASQAENIQKLLPNGDVRVRIEEVKSGRSKYSYIQFAEPK